MTRINFIAKLSGRKYPVGDFVPGLGAGPERAGPATAEAEVPSPARRSSGRDAGGVASGDPT